MSSASKIYSIELSSTALRQLKRLDETTQARLRAAFKLLSRTPRPPRSIKLKGEHGYRVRVGDYRIIYEVFDAKLVIVVLRLGHRREIYKSN